MKKPKDAEKYIPEPGIIVWWRGPGWYAGKMESDDVFYMIRLGDVPKGNGYRASQYAVAYNLESPRWYNKKEDFK